ncbi:nicolin-1-like isoform X2 [Tigriopus californicus]|uniref:nicolin-1-like isoform X2 n=1 Tax=Tigriopus californicus TaxID=6832 RepID=UPI0027DAA288|nr:nicolin-1-like isoform X2 [Tigriopus californicus]
MASRPQQTDNSRTSLIFSARGPIPIQLDEHPSNEWSSGALVLDLAFTQPESSLSLARLRGVNSTEGIKIGRNLTSSKSLSDWVVSLQSKVLMPDPHSELGSQDVGVVPSSESLAPWHDITAMRFLLRQPSPNWKTFNLEDIMVFRYPLGNAKGLSLRSPTLGTVPEREANDQECRPKSELESLIQQTQSLLMESLRIHNGEIRNNENPGHSVYEIMSLQLGQ